ncbi:MAG: 50S ribosomal protein L20 [Elusimicrobia bacterium HGW-Elusimicrobia-1]|jgi:large subunit ribosomal protein L20|nr:MAG: 50S ribosomal protein L20 [Elusimicrobia bacterium HGW-Elusimicrobia-1]
MRVKTGVSTRQRKKKYFKLAKGFYSDKSRKWRQVKQQVERALRTSYVGRKKRKREFRSLWIMRVNAASREMGISYSRFMHGLRLAGIGVDRKQLSEIALGDPKLFKAIVEAAQKALAAEPPKAPEAVSKQ